MQYEDIILVQTVESRPQTIIYDSMVLKAPDRFLWT